MIFSLAACRLYQCNVCGEGGEYESLVLNCPLFKHARIVLDSWHIVHQSTDAFAPVGHLHAVSYHLEPVIPPVPLPQATPGTPAPRASSQGKAQSIRHDPLHGQAAAASTDSCASNLYRLTDSARTQLTAENISSPATVIEVPAQATSGTLPEPAESIQPLQSVTPAAQSTAAWTADVQLQCGSTYARAVCCPYPRLEGACDSTATAAALDCALSAVQQG